MSPRVRLAVASLLSAGIVALVAFAAVAFRAPYEAEQLIVRDGVRTAHLSDYHPALAGTPFDTEVYQLEGPEPGGTVMVMGGVHANEPAGTLAAVVFLERAVVERGRLIVVTHANASAFTHNAAGQAAPQSYAIPTPWGERVFRYGDRLANPVHQYPDPEVHHHYPSGSLGSGQEARNLNRNFPGRPDGSATEQVAYALAQVVRTEGVDLIVDLHEARPMNPIVNAVVVHQRAGDVGALAVADLEALEGVSMRLELSPDGFQGVSQRELGEHTEALATLSETPNVAMDFVRGRTDADLVTDGRDPLLARAAAHPGLVYVPYDDDVGLPIDERVGRHLAVVTRLTSVFGEFDPEAAVTWSGVPSYREVVERGLGAFLADPDADPDAP